ncbi:MAG: A24 family peptidase [Planctomycetota bacterium]
MNQWIDFIPVAVCCVAAFIDLRTREIPDSLWISLLLFIPIRLWFLTPEIVIWHLFAGGLVALALGCFVAFGDRFGGGDVKLFAAVGAWYGIYAVASIAMWCAIAGLILAVIALLRGKKDFAYGPAIAAAVAVHWFAPDLLAQIGGWA